MSTEKDLVRDVKNIGINITSVWDLVNGPNDYTSALPILLRHLETAEDNWFKEGIVRALGVKNFACAVPRLIEEFVQSDDDLFKWAIANTIETICRKEHLEQLLALMEDRRHGSSRQMIALALGKLKDPHSIPVLVKALSQEEVVGHVIRALGKVGDTSVIEAIQPFTEHRTRWIRREAMKAIKRIQKRQLRGK